MPSAVKYSKRGRGEEGKNRKCLALTPKKKRLFFSGFLNLGGELF